MMKHHARTAAVALLSSDPIDGAGVVAGGIQPSLASFWTRVAATSGSRFVLVAFGITSSILTARVLGPAGLGVFAVMLTLGALGVQFANLGLPSALSYYLASDRSRLPQLLGVSLIWGLGLGSISACVLFVIFRAVPGLTPVSSTALLIAALAWIPFGLLLLLLLSLLLGLDRLSEYNGVPLVQAAAALGVMLLVLYTGSASVGAFYLASFGTLAATSLSLLVWLIRRVPRIVLPSRTLLRGAAGYGVRAYLSLLFSFTVLRFDLLMVARIVGNSEAGQYSIAASAGELITLPFAAIGTVVFAAVAGSGMRWETVRRVTITAGLALLPMAAAAAFLADPLIRIVFGPSYAAAVPAFYWLLPGVYLLGINTILMHYFAAIGMPLVTVLSPALASALNVGLNLVLIPRTGIAGAALGSTAAYALMLVSSLLYLRHRRRS